MNIEKLEQLLKDDTHEKRQISLYDFYKIVSSNLAIDLAYDTETRTYRYVIPIRSILSTNFSDNLILDHNWVIADNKAYIFSVKE